MAAEVFNGSSSESCGNCGVAMTCYHCGSASMQFNGVVINKEKAVVQYNLVCNDCKCKAVVTEKWIDENNNIAEQSKAITIGLIECNN